MLNDSTVSEDIQFYSTKLALERLKLKLIQLKAALCDHSYWDLQQMAIENFLKSYLIVINFNKQYNNMWVT